MADVRGFTAIRYQLPAGADASTRLTPPYDVIDAAYRKELAERDPFSAIHVDLPVGADPYGDAGRTYRSWLETGVIAADPKPSITLTHQSFTGPDGVSHVRKGLVAGVRLERLDAGVILPHEHTLKGPKEDRLRLFGACGATASQVFCVYDDPAFEVDALLNDASAGVPLCEAHSDDGVTHRAWRVDDPEKLAALTRFFADRQLLIADGHHRYETHLAYRDQQRLRLGRDDVPSGRVGIYLANMADPGTVVYPIHRLVRDLVDFDRAAFERALGQWFDVQPLGGTTLVERRGQMAAMEGGLGSRVFGAVYADGSGIRFGLRRETLESALAEIPAAEPLRSIDLTILHVLVLDRLLGITPEKLAAEAHIDYVKAEDTFLDKALSGRYNFGLLVPAPDVRAVARTAAAGFRMPQKSTYFFPKILSGLVFSPLE